jgi:cytoskeletal protein CcmA (bactofilin family)
MADHVTVIGRTSFVRGRISGSGSLEIAGRVEGEVSVTGDLTIESSGLVAANLSAQRITVKGGAIKGDLTAEEGIVLEAGARVVGDLNAPRVAIAEGALVRGHVQTGTGQKGTARKSAQASQSFQRSSSMNGPVTAREPRAIAKAAPPPPPAKKTPVQVPVQVQGQVASPRGSVLAGAKPQAAAAAAAKPAPKAPSPVVPVLKKGAKATQKKRA